MSLLYDRTRTKIIQLICIVSKVLLGKELEICVTLKIKARSTP
jgi:hypothetical protein